MNKQSTLTTFFDTSAGALANYAPRRKTTANVSKRLLSIIKQFREAEARVAGASVDGLGEMLAGVDQDDPKGRGTIKRGDSEVLVPVDAQLDDLDMDVGPRGGKAKAPPKKRQVRRKKSDASVADTVDSVDTEITDADGAAIVKPKRAPRKAAPRKRKAVAVDDGVEPAGDRDEYQPASAPAPKPRSKKRAVAGAPAATTRGEGVDETMEDGEVPSFMADDISQVPPEDRGKWRRQQQKKWRRAAVAGSVRPSQ